MLYTACKKEIYFHIDILIFNCYNASLYFIMKICYNIFNI